jgi:hypothetical protein
MSVLVPATSTRTAGAPAVTKQDEMPETLRPTAGTGGLGDGEGNSPNEQMAAILLTQ